MASFTHKLLPIGAIVAWLAHALPRPGPDVTVVVVPRPITVDGVISLPHGVWGGGSFWTEQINIAACFLVRLCAGPATVIPRLAAATARGGSEAGDASEPPWRACVADAICQAVIARLAKSLGCVPQSLVILALWHVCIRCGVVELAACIVSRAHTNRCSGGVRAIDTAVTTGVFVWRYTAYGAVPALCTLACTCAVGLLLGAPVGSPGTGHASPPYTVVPRLAYMTRAVAR